MQNEIEVLGDAVEKKLTRRLTADETAQLVGLLGKLLGLD